MQAMYVHAKGWYITRPVKVEHAERLAAYMVKACNNANIGYDQANRGGILQNGTGSKVKTECDCSSLVRQCIKEAIGKDPGNFTTLNEKAVLGEFRGDNGAQYFEIVGAYVSQSKTPVYNGDILVTKTKGHTAIVTGGNQRSTESRYYPKYTGTSASIVIALTAIGEKDTSLTHRKKIGTVNGITNAGTADGNTKMLQLLKAGSLLKA